jgi:uncharacterized surface protein with fasciclin (FAS1) repeats
VAAVTKAGLVDTLDSAEGLTVFAPTDDAFAALFREHVLRAYGVRPQTA